MGLNGLRTLEDGLASSIADISSVRSVALPAVASRIHIARNGSDSALGC